MTVKIPITWFKGRVLPEIGRRPTLLMEHGEARLLGQRRSSSLDSNRGDYLEVDLELCWLDGLDQPSWRNEGPYDVEDNQVKRLVWLALMTTLPHVARPEAGGGR